ncbi:helix-turn-helix domain-containing protein [Anaerotignum sp.]|uniref:helix-turn-helix domain-containing protein n=1 Tax=Anaerotignum sp. TaxID=2039241 RepID=UPI0028A84346|nr:helix-turn-helix transcriptional regulator [Anaerotignum sp.]
MMRGITQEVVHITLGEKIQQLRKASGISQEQLAEQLNVSRQSVSKWELNQAVPEINKVIMISELFSISTDELLREKSVNQSEEDGKRADTITLEEITKMNLANRQIIIGVKTLVLGLVMLVLEFLFLPVFGMIQKEHVNGQGFYTEFMRYAFMQPMPIVFTITIAICLIGVLCLLRGYFYRKNNIANT